MLAFAMCFILLANFASAELTHKQNTDLNYTMTSNFASYCILTTINTPDGFNSLEMNATSAGSQTFLFQIDGSNFSSLGEHRLNIACFGGSTVVTEYESVTVTPTGEQMTIMSVSTQIFASISTFALFVLFLFLSNKGLKAEQISKEESPGIKFLFVGLSLVFLIAHIVITNIIIHDNLGIGTMASAYTSVMYIFFTIIIMMFLFTLMKIIVWEVGIWQKSKGLK